MKILVTGAAGAIGSVLCPRLEELGHKVIPTDINEEGDTYFMDVTSPGDVWNVVAQSGPDVIIHLAASKLAVEGELHPVGFVNVNVNGTFNVLSAASATKAKLMFASTCKAADPETVYGACKLIAERAVLSAGQTAVRFYNILECGPSVKTIWEAIPEPDAIPYTDCWRYIITVDTAVESVITALELPPGRYAPDPGHSWHMLDVAQEMYPDRTLVLIPNRRGDRHKEPLHAACETRSYLPSGLMQITSPHDP